MATPKQLPTLALAELDEVVGSTNKKKPKFAVPRTPPLPGIPRPIIPRPRPYRPIRPLHNTR